MRKRFASPHIVFQNINVNAIQDNSGIFVGTNEQNNWSTNVHSKSGFGTVFGNRNHVSRNIHLFRDDDVIDTPIASRTGAMAL